MSLHVQLIPEKCTWSGVVKLINSQVSFLYCLFLSPVPIKSWCLCVLPTPATLSRLTEEWWNRQWPWLPEMHSQGLVAVMCLHPLAWRQVNYKFRLPDILQVRKWEILIGLNLLIYLGLRMSCGTLPVSLFVSCSVMCEAVLISFLCECRQVSLLVCCMGIFIPIV